MAGRPSTYTEEMGQRITDWISEGGSLYQFIEQHEDSPPLRTIYQWTQDIPEFGLRFRRAREFQGWAVAEMMMPIAQGKIDDPQAAHSQFRAIAWLSARLSPKNFGDKMDLNHGGQSDGKPITHEFKWTE